ncbi:MAG: PH domain-containing protein [Verrucomicrobiota bacterium]|nr:PH domain-containing protein [Verrucomicrobiota bacterium]
MPQEQTIFKGSRSLVTQIGTITLLVFLDIAACVAGIMLNPLYFIGSAIASLLFVGVLLSVKSTQYELTTERLRITTGILTKRTEEMELYRVRDATLVQPFLLRLFGKGNIEIIAVDASTSAVCIEGISQAAAVRESLRHAIEECRTRKGVRIAEYDGPGGIPPRID